MDYVMVNGESVRKEETNLTSFFWNEPQLLHHKIWFGFGGIPLFSENLKLLKQQLEMLGGKIPVLFKNERELFRITKRMLNKNKFFRSGYITFHLFTQSDKTNFICTSSSFSDFDFPFSEQGLLLHFSGLKVDSGNPFNAFALSHDLFWKIEKKRNNNSQFHNSIFLNECEMVCNSGSANIFMISDKTLITPSLETGCYNDVLRNYIIDIAEQLKFNIMESDRINKDDVFKMNELFLASEGSGIQWIMGIDNKRFVRNQSVLIHQKLNEFLKRKVH